MANRGIFMGMRPSFTMLKDTLAPTSITSSRVIWAATVTRAPVWTQIGKGAMPNRSRVNGSGLPSQKPHSTCVRICVVVGVGTVAVVAGVGTVVVVAGVDV